MGELIENLPAIVPAMLMGAILPLLGIAVVALTPARKNTYFPLIFFGIAAFFVSLAVVAVALLVLARGLLASISVTATEGDRVVMIGGCLVLVFFYIVTEGLRYFSYKSALKKKEKIGFGGLLYGCGFVLAQDLLVLGIASTGEFSLSQALGFGVLMMICGAIYLLLSEISFYTTAEGHPLVGSAIASAYFILLAVMLVFANVVITYVVVGLALAFALLMGYVLLPLPFKKKGGAC